MEDIKWNATAELGKIPKEASAGASSNEEIGAASAPMHGPCFGGE
jgi:hypothetical protein